LFGRSWLLLIALILILLVIVVIIAAVCGTDKAQAPEPGACGPNPAPAPTGVGPGDFGFRQITQPGPGDSVHSPLHMVGQAFPFEGAYSITIVNASGGTIASMNYNKSNANLAFTADLPFSVSASTPACAWYHERSGRDGSPVGITQIPVTLLP